MCFLQCPCCIQNLHFSMPHKQEILTLYSYISIKRWLAHKASVSSHSLLSLALAVIEHQKRLLTEVVVFPFLEIFKTWLGMALSGFWSLYPTQDAGQMVSRGPCQPHPFWVTPETPCTVQPCCSYRPAEGVLSALLLFLWLLRKWISQDLASSDTKQLEFPPPFFQKTDGFYYDCQ